MTLDFSLLEGLQDGALVVDRNQNVLFANSSLLKTCGLAASRVVGCKCQDAMGGFRFLCGGHGHEDCPHKQVIQTGQSLAFSCRHRMPDGETKTFQIFTCPLKNEKEEVEQTLRIVREVSDREMVSGPLFGNAMQQEALLRRHSPFFHCFMDRDLILQYVTPNLEKIAGMSVDQIVGSPCHEIFGVFSGDESDPDQQNRCVGCRMDEVLNQGETITFIKSSHSGDFEITATPIRNDQGKIIGVLTSGAEVTQLVRAKSALRETEANYDYLYHNLADAVFIMDAKGLILDVNRVAEQRLGYTLNEFRQMSPRDFNAPEKIDGIKDRLRRVWEQDHIFFETTHIARDGRHIPTEVNASVIEYQGKQVIISVARDITERKRAEQALQESEYRFRGLFMNMTNGVAIYEAVNDGEDFIIRDLNPFGLRKSGRTRDQIIGHSVSWVFPGVVEMGLFEVFQRVYRTGQPEHLPASMYDDEQLKAWYDNYVYKLPSGEIVAVYEDITERKRAEDELRKSERRYFSLYNNSHAVMLVINPENGDIVDANPAACAFYGYTREEFLRLKISDINLLGADAVRQKMDHALSKQEYPFHFEHRLKNGEVRNVEVFSGPIDIGNRVVLFSIIHDVTDQRRAREEAARAKAEWDKTFDSMGDIITIQDLDMRIVRANRAAGEFFKIDPDELVGSHCYRVFQDCETPCPECPLTATSQDLQGHMQVIHHNRLGRIFQVSSTPIFDEKEEMKYLVHVAKDITEQKELEDELFQAHKMEAMGTLAGGIAHDFNNILAAILGFIQLAQMEPVDPEERADALDKALTASYRARDLVNQILTFSRKGGTLMEPVEPHLIIQESLKLLRASIPSTIEIREEIDKECGTVLSDPTRLQQIIVNLCTNALHAMQDQKGVLTVKLGLTEITEDDHFAETVVEPGRYILLTVSDTGCGMAQVIQDRIFEPYFTTKEVGKGTGMGLAMVHSIVQQSGGMIRVESTEGAGSTFRVFLPALPPESLPDAREDEEPTELFGQERILIVDDEKEIAQLLEKSLGRFGYRITCHSSSLDAIAAFKADPGGFDLIITDQTMPDLTGAELAREILAIRPGMPILLCTGYSSTLSEEIARDIGIRKYIMKPVDIDKLARTIRSVCDSDPR